MSFQITTFTDIYAKSLQEAEFTLDGLGDLIRTTEAPAKASLPLLKLARFGAHPSPGGCLRHDANVISISGVEGDYDGGTCAVQEAVDRLETAGLAHVVYTTPSHSPSAPRWRALLPFSKELPPAERARMANRLNGIFGGILSIESWSLSQTYYFGHVNGAAAEVYVHDVEEHIDEADELDATAQAYRPAVPPAGSKSTTPPDFDKLSESDLLDLIRTGQHYYRPVLRIAAGWAKARMSETDAEANLAVAFDAVPLAQRTKKWRQARGNLPKWIKQTFARILKRRAYLRALAAHLGDAPPWRGAVRLNQFAQRIEVSDPFPPQPGQVTVTWREILDPEDILEALMHAQETGFDQAGKTAVRDALTIIARRNAYHPVRDWLNALPPWDGEERIGRLFYNTYFRTELPEIDLGNPASSERRDEIVRYLEETACCFMVGAVARIFVPGVKVDTLPVLVGRQGWNKSQGIRALVPDPAWFSDDVSASLVDRDTKESLSGKWILELAEFPHIRREIEKVKGFFSRQSDRYRRAYAPATRDWPRQCVFMATCNELEFIDTTGNRRFWPVLMSSLADVAAIVRDREQLWAEAVHWYRTGYEWWLSPSLEAIAAEVQAAFGEEDIWDDPIAAFVGPLKQTTLSAVLTGCFGYSLSADNGSGGGRTAGKAEQMRAAGCLRRLQWHRDHRRRIQGKREWIWVPPAPVAGGGNG